MSSRFNKSDNNWSADSKLFVDQYGENLESQADLTADENEI